MRRPLRDFALRLVIIAAILLTLGRVYASAVVTPMLPAMAWVIEAVDDRFRVEQMGIANRKADTFIELKATPVRMFMLGNRVLMPDAKLFFEPAILIGSVLQPGILFLAIILAWPCARLRTLGLRVLLAVPVIALLLVVNVPLGFVGVMPISGSIFPIFRWLRWSTGTISYKPGGLWRWRLRQRFSLGPQPIDGAITHRRNDAKRISRA